MYKTLDKLRCPACIKLQPSKLELSKDLLICTNDACRYTFKFHKKTPLLLTTTGDTLNYYTKKENHERKNKSTQKFTSK